MKFASRVDNLKPYIPGEQPNDRVYIKLNANENPYPPGESVQKVLSSFDTKQLSLYPDPDATKLRQAYAKMNGVSESMVYAGNGSDEILSFVFYTLFGSDKPLYLPEHNYSIYPEYAGYYNNPLKRIPLNDDFSIDLSKFVAEDCGGIIFANPNAPTGIELPVTQIKRLLDSVPRDLPVVVDEAYIDFGAQSVVPLLKDYENLIVTRTFSKGMCFAGARLGFVIANENVINKIVTVKNSFNHFPIDAIVQEIGVATCESSDYYKGINATIANTRDWFAQSLTDNGWNVIPSMTNFLFVSKEGISGEEIYQKAKSAGILIRYFNHAGIESFVRITVGKREDMQSLLEVLLGE